MGTDEEPLLRIGDGGLKQIAQAARAEGRQRMVERLQRHRRGDRLVTDLVDFAVEQKAEPVFALAPDQVLPHVGLHRFRRAAVEVDHAVLVLPRQVDLHRPEPRDAAHQWIDGGLHQRAGDGSIHRVAALAQNIGPCLDRFGLWGGDQPVAHAESSARLGTGARCFRAFRQALFQRQRRGENLAISRRQGPMTCSPNGIPCASRPQGTVATVANASVGA